MDKSRLIKAATRFLKSQEYEIIDVDEESFTQIVCKDPNYFVFVHVKEGLTDDNINRTEFENACMNYINSHIFETETPIRFDVIGIKPSFLNEGKALLRHHLDAINPINDCE